MDHQRWVPGKDIVNRPGLNAEKVPVSSLLVECSDRCCLRDQCSGGISIYTFINSAVSVMQPDQDLRLSTF